jgi:glycosyltransferase involved in cell wall biosynthesis
LEELLSNTDPDVLIVDRPSDHEMAHYLASAMATIFVSPNEGFGLPPLESLYAGIPVVAYGGVPSISDCSLGGVLRIAEPAVENISAALRQLDKPEVCQQLWREAAKNQLATWSDFARQIAIWATSP